MDNLEKIFESLPKKKLGFFADWKIKIDLYRLMFFGRLNKTSGVFNWQPSILNKALIAAIVLFVIFGATSIFAYANNNIVPGDAIYPLKKVVEKLEQKIAPNKIAKIAVYEKVSVRRLQEALNLSKEASSTSVSSINEDINKNIKEVVVNHQAVVESINNLDNYEKAAKQAAKAKDLDKAKTDYLNQIAEYASSVKDEKTLEEVKQAQDIIDNQKYKYKDQEFVDENDDKNLGNENQKDNQEKNKSNDENGDNLDKKTEQTSGENTTNKAENKDDKNKNREESDLKY